MDKQPLEGLRIDVGRPVRTMYRILRRAGEIRSVWRIVWQGEDSAWVFGDGFFAHARTDWKWCPENRAQLRGMAWKVSGMGGADDDSEPCTKEEALAILAKHGTAPDSIDNGTYPTHAELIRFAEIQAIHNQRVREALKGLGPRR